jgi:hypothetical protein
MFDTMDLPTVDFSDQNCWELPDLEQNDVLGKKEVPNPLTCPIPCMNTGFPNNFALRRCFIDHLNFDPLLTAAMSAVVAGTVR